MNWYPINRDTFKDADGDVMSYSVTLADGSPLPIGIIYDPVKGIGIDSSAFKSNQVFTLVDTADDGHGGRTSTTFHISFKTKPNSRISAILSRIMTFWFNMAARAVAFRWKFKQF